MRTESGAAIPRSPARALHLPEREHGGFEIRTSALRISTLMVGLAVRDKRPLLSNMIAQKGLALQLETSIAVSVRTSRQAC
jgi:hypothetical protein